MLGGLKTTLCKVGFALQTEQNLTSKVEECISDREEGRERGMHFVHTHTLSLTHTHTHTHTHAHTHTHTVSSKRALLAELQGELSELQRVRSKVNDDDSSKTVSREIWQTFV